MCFVSSAKAKPGLGFYSPTVNLFMQQTSPGLELKKQNTLFRLK